MDSINLLVIDTARRILEKHVTRELLHEPVSGPCYAAFWSALESAGLHRIMLDEEFGGAGLPPEIGLEVTRLFAWFAAPVPFAETLLASWIAGRAGLEIPDGPMTLALGNEAISLSQDAAGEWRLYGEVADVPWGRLATVLLVTERNDVTVFAMLPPGFAQCSPGLGIAGEPRDRLAWDRKLSMGSVLASPTGLRLRDCRALGAAMRATQMAGAGERICEMTVAHVRSRVQFGKPLASFQAIQQSLAQITTAVAASTVGAARASRAFDRRDNAWVHAAIGKIRAGEAAGLIASLAHQLHGAIGFTEEYHLHGLTKRLWAWRDEFGAETDWAKSYGQCLIAAGADQLWPNFVDL